MMLPHWPAPVSPLPGSPRERILPLLKAMGNPQDRLPPVVQVAGTNGKGSSIAFLRAMLEAAGYKVHAYTSPHLKRFSERIVLAGREISPQALHAAIEVARQAAGGAAHEFFDGTTAAALYAFAATPADVLLMEVGIGGRFDATNVTPAVLTVITTISLDHAGVLGGSLESIAWHKAGILREGVPCVVSYQPEAALKVIREEAAKVGAPLMVYGEHWAVRRTETGMEYVTQDGAAELPAPALAGYHQYINAGNAVCAATLLDGFDIGEGAVAAGLSRAQWPARLQKLGAHPGLPAQAELWLDGAHNPAGCEALALYARGEWGDVPLYVIFGATRGRDYAAMVAPFVPQAVRIFAVPVEGEANSASARDIAAVAPVEMCENLRDAFARIPDGACRVLVTGSLHFGRLF